MSKSLEGKRALITGAGGGMGQSHAVLMAERGADIVIHDIKADGAEETAEMVRRVGCDASVLVVDIRDVSAFTAAVCDAGPVDILVNNAGVGGARRAIEDINEDVIVFSGISNPEKFSYGLEKIGAKIDKHFIYPDHKNITEDNAKEIYEYSKSKNLRVITTEKDHVKLKDSKENSYRKRLYLNSIIARVRIRLDNKILINFLRERKLIK